MKIKTKFDKAVKAEDIVHGDCFYFKGSNCYIKTLPLPNESDCRYAFAVDLSTGQTVKIDSEAIVTPVDAEVVIK